MNSWNKIIDIAKNGNAEPPKRVIKTDAEWQNLLSEEAFYVTRQHGTERAFSNGMCSLFEPGIYACICCDTHLFDSNSKFESGTGWPSFGDPVKENVVSYHGDFSHGMQRIEARCNICDAHLGHVFPDGPPPSCLRYCINAVSLRKISE